MVWDLQTTHSAQVARQHYGVHVGFLGNLQPAMIETYRGISRLWHQFLEQGYGTSANTPRVLAQAKRKRDAGGEQAKRKRGAGGDQAKRKHEAGGDQVKRKRDAGGATRRRAPLSHRPRVASDVHDVDDRHDIHDRHDHHDRHDRWCTAYEDITHGL